MSTDPYSDNRRVLAMLADASDGCTEPLLLAHSLRLRTLVDLIVAGLAPMTGERTHAGGYEARALSHRRLAQGRCR